jgi:tRNA threonylcarbamoyladenosine biosynthesis protein TsaE
MYNGTSMNHCDLLCETAGVAATQALGAALAARLQPGDILALSGDLGTGKTAFTQGLARGLGITRPVTSPTFVLVNQYPTPQGFRLQHVDCYRLANAPLEMWDVGLDDLLAGDDVVVIEWAERIPELLPAEHLEIRFTYLDPTRRRLCFVGHGPRFATILAGMARLDCSQDVPA